MQLPTECSTAEQFTAIMMEIWDGELHELYDEWNNAQAVIRFYRIPRDHNSVALANGEGNVYRFPNGTRCFVNTTGDAVEPVAPIRRRN